MKRKGHKIAFYIVTIFPHLIDPYLSESLFGRARERRIVTVDYLNPRDFTSDTHRTVDDKPFGGGPGMVMKVEPIYRAVLQIQSKIKRRKKNKKTRTILFSTRGKQFNAKTAQRLARYDNLIFICGRYEGVDERVAEHIADEEISIGDYVLSGGELPALVVTEAVSRFIPGFLGTYESLEEMKGSYPVYTRPAEFRTQRGRGSRTWSVPEELLSGDHKKIEGWRKRHGSS